MILVRKISIAKIPAGVTLEEHLNDQITGHAELAAARLVAIHEIDHAFTSPLPAGGKSVKIQPTALRLYFEA